MYQSQKSNFSDHFLFKICIFLVFETKTWKMRGMTYTFLVEWRPIQWTFWCFFSYFDLRNSISPLDTHFISKLPKCVKIRKDGLKVPKNGIFHIPWDDRTALGGVQLGPITLSFGHPCRVHVIFIKILKRNNPKECAMSNQSTAQSHIITATFAKKSRARHCSKHGFIAF